MKYKYIILIIAVILSFGLGAFIANATKTTISIPLGMILMLIPFVIFCLFFEIFLIKDIKDTIKSKKNKKKKKQKNNIIWSIIILIIWSVFSIYQILYCYFAVVDLINGPKEIIICNVQIEIKRSGGKYKRIFYFLTGESLDHEHKSILIRGEKDRKNIDILLEKNNNFKIYYFEKLNQIYNFEIYE